MKNLSKYNQDATDRYHASEDEEESRFSQQSQLVQDEEDEISETDHVQVQKKDEIFVTGAKKKKVFYQQFHIAPERRLFAPRGLALSGLDKQQQQQQQQQQTIRNSNTTTTGNQDDDRMTRWNVRVGDIIPKLSEYRSKGEDEYEEVFETDHVSMDMPANSVIGRANLLLGTHCRNATGRGLGIVPSVTLRCGLYFLRVATTAAAATSSANDDDVSKLALRSISMQGDIHMVANDSNDHNDTNNTRTDWWERVCYRGVELSVLCAKYPELKRYTKELVEFESFSSSLSATAIPGDSKGTQSFSFGVIPSMPVVTKSDRIFYSSLSIRPPWGKYKQLGVFSIQSSQLCDIG
eukprot:scaffold35935_cov44-Attheya_sp.AAC.5